MIQEGTWLSDLYITYYDGEHVYGKTWEQLMERFGLSWKVEIEHVRMLPR